MLPSRSGILAEPINKTVFPSNTVATFITFNDSVMRIFTQNSFNNLLFTCARRF